MYFDVRMPPAANFDICSPSEIVKNIESSSDEHHQSTDSSGCSRQTTSSSSGSSKCQTCSFKRNHSSSNCKEFSNSNVSQAQTRGGNVNMRHAFERAYRVGEVLGRGGFGTVYAGIRVRDGRHVAIKHVARVKVSEWDEVCGRSNIFVVLKYFYLLYPSIFSFSAAFWKKSPFGVEITSLSAEHRRSYKAA